MNGSAETPHDPLHDSESESTACGFRAEERIEHFGLRWRGHAATRVGDLQSHVITLRQREIRRRFPCQGYTACRHPNHSISIAYGIRSVCDQIHHNLPKLRRTGPDGRKIPVKTGLDHSMLGYENL